MAPYLTLMSEDAPQRRHDLREVFNALRWLVHTGAPWRYLPHDLPPWPAVYQQTRRWLAAGCFEAMVHDLRALLRWAAGRNAHPRRSSSTAPRGNRRRRAGTGPGTTATSGARAARSTRPSTRWATCWRCRSPRPMPRTGPRWRRWPRRCRRRPGETVEVAFVDQGYTGEEPAARRRRARHPPGGRQAARGQARLRAAAAALGGRALLRLGRHASAAWPKTTNGCPKWSPACISSPLLSLMLHRLVTVVAQSP